MTPRRESNPSGDSLFLATMPKYCPGPSQASLRSQATHLGSQFPTYGQRHAMVTTYLRQTHVWSPTTHERPALSQDDPEDMLMGQSCSTPVTNGRIEGQTGHGLAVGEALQTIKTERCALMVASRTQRSELLASKINILLDIVVSETGKPVDYAPVRDEAQKAATTFHRLGGHFSSMARCRCFQTRSRVPSQMSLT